MNPEVRPVASNTDGAVARDQSKLISREGRQSYAYNCTRQSFLASALEVANTHWQRLRGLIGTNSRDFSLGRALLITPSHGIHTLGMRFVIDVIYLDENNTVVHLEENVRPWRMTPLRMDAATVLELPSHTIWNTGTAVGDQLEIATEVAAKAVA